MFRVLTRIIADAMVVAIGLFVVRTVSALAVFRVNPALLRERATVLLHKGQPWTDRLILLGFMGTAFVGVPAVAARAGQFVLHQRRAMPVEVRGFMGSIFPVGYRADPATRRSPSGWRGPRQPQNGEYSGGVTPLRRRYGTVCPSVQGKWSSNSMSARPRVTLFPNWTMFCCIAASLTPRSIWMV